MPTPTESAALLSRALDQAGDVLVRVHKDQLDDPTPCEEWTVRRLVAHLVADPPNFIAMSKGEHPDWSAEPPLSADWTGDFRSGADDLIHRWHQAGEDASPQSMDWQTAEFAVHTWDLARATGQSAQLDPAVAQRGLDFMRSAMTPENRGHAFGPERPAPEGASVYEQLAAFAGRDPSWHRPA